MRNICSKLCSLLLLVMLVVPIAANANSITTGNAVATLYSDVDTITPGQNIWLALELQPREGWHTYWRNPGDSGLPTTINWTLPEGFEAGDIRWPAPEAIPYGPLMNFGYHRDHLLMVPVSAPNDLSLGDTINISARADWLICEDICIPESADLTLALLVGDQTVLSTANDKFIQAQSEWPMPATWQTTYQISGGNLVLQMVGAQLGPELEEAPRFFPFLEGLILAPEAQAVQQAGDAFSFSCRPCPNPFQIQSLAGHRFSAKHAKR